jgi:uncharacterized membrane protein YGL010W
MNPKLHALFTEYANDHRHPTNQLTHKIAIPLIVFHIVAMLDWVALFPAGGLQVTAGMVLYALATAWYLAMHPKLGVIMALLFGLCFPLGRAVTALPNGKAILVTIAVVGWMVQLAGHAVWEKKSPSFLRNILQALVGPIFFVAKLTGDWKPSQAA